MYVEPIVLRKPSIDYLIKDFTKFPIIHGTTKKALEIMEETGYFPTGIPSKDDHYALDPMEGNIYGYIFDPFDTQANFGVTHYARSNSIRDYLRENLPRQKYLIEHLPGTIIEYGSPEYMDMDAENRTIKGLFSKLSENHKKALLDETLQLENGRVVLFNHNIVSEHLVTLNHHADCIQIRCPNGIKKDLVQKVYTLDEFNSKYL